ncbi:MULTISPECIES: hypothetical protein [unclassified Desulfovibrio]|uniref:hypothetical protein n=1 Tax=unclassified Desulfovibrio TaxID=2593640 RepID=UPI002FDA198B
MKKVKPLPRPWAPSSKTGAAAKAPVPVPMLRTCHDGLLLVYFKPFFAVFDDIALWGKLLALEARAISL